MRGKHQHGYNSNILRNCFYFKAFCYSCTDTKRLEVYFVLFSSFYFAIKGKVCELNVGYNLRSYCLDLKKYFINSN